MEEREPTPVFAAPEPEPEPEPMSESIFDPEPDPEPIYDPNLNAESEPLELTGAMMAQPEPVYQQEQQMHYQPQPDYTNYGQPLVGDPAAMASGASIAGLAQAVARERALALGNQGLTIEQLVREICTPILKHWLDTNLPYMVERIVKQEIERIVNRSERM